MVTESSSVTSSAQERRPESSVGLSTDAEDSNTAPDTPELDTVSSPVVMPEAKSRITLPSTTTLHEPLRVPVFKTNSISSPQTESEAPEPKRLRVSSPLNLTTTANSPVSGLFQAGSTNHSDVSLVKEPDQPVVLPPAYPPPTQSPIFKHINSIHTGQKVS